MKFFQSAAMAAAVAALAFTASAASASTTTQVDISSYVNDNFSVSQPNGLSAGNANTPIASQQFNLLSPTGNNVWAGLSTGDTVDIKVSIANATQVTTLMNTFYGVNGLNTANVTMLGTGGAIDSFDLYGGVDIRDYNNWVWTNTINGTSTQEWWTNDVNSVPGTDDSSHRLDAQIFNLNAGFQGQTLTDILITTGAAGYNFSQPFLSAVDVTSGAVPEPATWATMFMGLFGLGAALRTRRAHKPAALRA